MEMKDLAKRWKEEVDKEVKVALALDELRRHQEGLEKMRKAGIYLPMTEDFHVKDTFFIKAVNMFGAENRYFQYSPGESVHVFATVEGVSVTAVLSQDEMRELVATFLPAPENYRIRGL